MTLSTLPNDPETLRAVNAEMARIQQHQAAGRFEAAEAALADLLERYPEHPQILHLKALNQIGTGQDAAGRSLLDQILQHDPDNVQARVDYGASLARAGQIDAAIPHFQQAVEQAPNHALAQANLGAALVVQQDYEAAIKTLTRAAELDGSVIDVHLNLAQAYMRNQNFVAAIGPLFRALAVDPQSVAAHVNLAQALFRAERHETAEHHARRALELYPGADEAKLHLGNTLAAMGRMEEAVDTLLSVARLSSGVGRQALIRLVSLRKTTPDSPEAALLASYGGRMDDLPGPVRSGLLFAMAKAADDQDDPATAMTHYRAANALTAEQFPFDQDTHVARQQRMRDLVTPAFVARHRAAGLQDIAPIFICGMPRSGTTLVEQMFSRHSQVQAGGELRAVNTAFARSPGIYAVLEREAPDESVTDDMLTQLAEHYQSVLQAEGLRAEHVTDKMPINYLYAGVLALALPRAKVLIMRRHPLDTLLSNFMQHFGRNQPFSSRIDALAEVYKQYHLTAHHLVSVLPQQVRFVDYEAVVADPEGQMRAAAEFAGLPFEAQMLDYAASSRPVNTASVSQVRAPIYSTSAGRWQRYAPHLRDLAEALGDLLSDADRAACGL